MLTNPRFDILYKYLLQINQLRYHVENLNNMKLIHRDYLDYTLIVEYMHNT